ncbi:Peptidase family S41 [Aquimarina amphilecti]|uniref:Peptidase family S41 n=2 Tax=Aquimarina amphilecti TaxID=1038014 RepID=A0A1H7HAP5_AQUAM|nr:Peptidase family S41 [Aquimarina amphilecti]
MFEKNSLLKHIKMKTTIITLIISLLTIIGFGQKLELEKASPFTAVTWDNDQPVVECNNEWYHFEKLDHFDKDELIRFCKKEYNTRWKKRFSEDLVEVLRSLNYIPNKDVYLVLSRNGVAKTYTGTFTFENRQSCLHYNNISKPSKKNTISKEKTKKSIGKTEAIEDIKQFKEILDNRSSYSQLSNFNYYTAIDEIITLILKREDSIQIDELVYEISKVMAEIGDRHASIKNESFDKKNHESYEQKLPFGITILDKQVIAVKKGFRNNSYQYYYKNYPYIKSINGIHIDTLITNYNYRDKKAPKEAKLTRGANAIEQYGSLLFNNNKRNLKRVEVMFTDGKNEKKDIHKLTLDSKGYVSTLRIANYNAIKNTTNTGQFDSLKRLLTDNIGYIKIPMMFNYKKVDSLEHFIETTMKEFSNTKALIIDIRNNPGGTRDILQTFANYMIPQGQSPWVANVGYLRTNKIIDTDEHSMSSRYLYSYNSAEFSNSDRVAIDEFNKTYKIEQEFDHSKFSGPFYMVLKHKKTFYKQPVYILVNESSFSAATVFTAAYKGLPNIKVVGVTTDGSSGNSKEMYLTNSNIKVKVSTMLSFQRNGKTLDGNGTEPDIYIPIDIEQIFTGKDTQLEKLVAIINDRK